MRYDNYKKQGVNIELLRYETKAKKRRDEYLDWLGFLIIIGLIASLLWV